MPVTERINERVRRLPERAQAEVLDFVEFLLTKSERETRKPETTEQEPAQQEERAWNQFSLASALRGMEDEDGPDYTEDDLKERFS